MAVLVSVGLFNARSASAQAAESSFDVKSARPNHTPGCCDRWDFAASHGAVTSENAPLLRIISRAYNLTDDRVSAPAWVECECYDIRANAATSDAPDRELMMMHRELLTERFPLVAHNEAEERPVLALLLDKGEAKMPPDGAKVSMPPINAGRILFMPKTFGDLCERVGRVTGRPVIDRPDTGRMRSC